MTAKHKTLFISDLHLQAEQPEITAKFLQLLANTNSEIDALYILGDLFEVWIGDDEHSPFNQQIVQALRAATDKGLKIYFTHGNRDFLIGKAFLQATGCQLLMDEKIISLYGAPVLLMHGDTLCTGDVEYLKARKLGRNRILQFLFLLLPISKRQKIADNMRAKSMRHTQTTAKEIMDVTPQAVIDVMQNHHVKFLIHGHTHRPATHEIIGHGIDGKRIVLGAWHEKAYVLSWDEDGVREIHIF